MGTGEGTPAVPDPVRAREQQLMRPIGIATLVGVALAVGARFILQGLGSTDTRVERLEQIYQHGGDWILAAVVSAAGYAVLAIPVIFLFRAAKARNQRVASRLIGLIAVAPVFLAIASVLGGFGFDDIAKQFNEIQRESGARDAAALADAARELERESTTLQIATGFGFAGSLGFAAGVLYTSLWAMRTGLLTRFLGTFGMAVAVVFILIPDGVLIWFVGVGLMLIGLRPGGRPPAWEAGVAMPWPKPGEEPRPEPAGDVVEGQGSELPPGDPSHERAEASQPGAPRRKRKRRS